MNDLISRQAAIDAVHEEFDDCLVWDESGQRTADEFEIIIDRLPSAQPEIIRCKDCDAWDRDNVINHVAACAEWSDPENGMTRYTKECDYCSRAGRSEDE